MKALTVWQPWASLIIAGAKPYEFRGWRFPSSLIGQRIVIHAAAKKLDRDDTKDLLDLTRSPKVWPLETAMTCLKPHLAVPVLTDALFASTGLPFACGLGTAVLGEPRLGPEIAEEFGVPRANDSDRDEHANWGWPMLNIERWPEPVPMRGAQGFWTWPEPADAML